MPDYVNPVVVMQLAMSELFRVTGVVGFPVAATVHNEDGCVRVLLTFWSQLTGTRALGTLVLQTLRSPDAWQPDNLCKLLAEPLAEYSKVKAEADGKKSRPRWENN